MPLKVYIALLSATVVVVLGFLSTPTSELTSQVLPWLFLAALFGIAEYGGLVFHHEGGRQGLTVAEAVLVPMVVGLTEAQVVWGVTVATGIVYVLNPRVTAVKAAFNTAQYGCAAAVTALIWQSLKEPSGSLTPRNAAVAVVAILAFAVITHILVAIAISLAERKSFVDISRDIATAIGWNIFGNITLGLFFAASYLGGTWTIVLFPVPLGALYFGYRAVVRQSRERERVESLHAASRALAASPNFEDALVGFLRAMKEIVSAAEGRAVLNVNKQWVASSVRGTETTRNVEPLEAGPMLTLIEHFRATPESLVIAGDTPADSELLNSLNARSLVAIPLLKDDEYAGYLMGLDRVGAEEFSDSDARLLEALGNELVLTLDSYRLFAQVAEERERFQQIFAGSKEGICLLDEGGVIRAWNPALARITGFAEEDIIGEKWSERILVRDRHHQRVEGMEIVKVAPDEELELVTRQGPPRWVAIMSGEVQSEDEKSWVVLVRDITAEHELEESKSDFLSTISHELRTPLTTIKGSLQVLSRPNATADSTIGKQMIEIMKRGSDRLERLVMNLLAVSQMEAGDVQVYPDEVPLEEMVRARIASILVDHPQVEVNAQPDIVVRADRERLAQAVEHILDNARKFGPETGLIRVEIAKENGYARLSITDEGPGIPKIDQERIFDRFVRLGHVLTRDTQGPGVGLFIAKRSVDAMGGSIVIDSEPGQGSTFHVRIPLALAAVEPLSSA